MRNHRLQLLSAPFAASPAPDAPPAQRPKAALLSRRGVVLVAVLLVTVVLALASYQYADVMTSEHKASENAVRQAQVRAAAESGVWYVAGMLADPTALSMLTGNLWDNQQYFQDVIVRQDDNPRYNCKFSILSAPYDPTNMATTTPRMGVTDEAGKININALMVLDPTGNTLYYMLMTLPNMTSDIACAIVDWIDADDNPYSAPDGSGSTGKEISYYSGLNPAYRCKNAPLDSLEELLLVYGVTPQLLYGSDVNRNGVQDNGEIGASGAFDPGLAAYLTVYSKEMNVSSGTTGGLAQYTQRVDLSNTTDLTTTYTNILSAINDVNTTNFILLYMIYGPTATPTATTTTGNASKTTAGNLGSLSASSLNLTTATVKKVVTSVYDLINVSVQVPATDPKGNPTVYASPLNDPTTLSSMLPVLLDNLSPVPDQQRIGRININTCSQTVLTALTTMVPATGLTADMVTQIMAAQPFYQQNYTPDPSYNTPAWLITQNILTPAIMSKLEPYITTYTQVYRFQVVAYFDGGGPMARIDAVVDTNPLVTTQAGNIVTGTGGPRVLYQRDLTELGKGFDPQNFQQQ